jgi:maltose-binding protein MalE
MQAGPCGYDIMLISPAWLADVVADNAAITLGDHVAKYGADREFDDINPAFKDWMSCGGKIYGLVVDGDVLVTYYRKHIFLDAEYQKTFKEKNG